MLKKISLFLSVHLGHFFLNLLATTWRYEVQGWDACQAAAKSGKPQIWITWHGRLILSTWYARHQHIATMISRSADGELIARVVQKMGYVTARGSSSRGGTVAALALLDLIKNGKTAAMICDGPRGPIYKMKPGPAFLAIQSGATVTPVIGAADRAWIFKSWDHFMLPKPFAKVFLLFGEQIQVTQTDDLKAITRTLETALNTLLAQANSLANA